MEIKVPFLTEAIGAGDIVKAATSAAGVKPCQPCEERKRRMNAGLQFVPRSNGWTKPPRVPEGWTREAEYQDVNKTIQLFHHTSGKLIIWDVTTGEYRNSHTFCCGDRMRDLVAQKWEELCRS